MFQVNGIDGFDGRLYMPRTGVWHAKLKIDSAKKLDGAVAVHIDKDRLSLAGFVVAGNAWQDTGYLRVVGGNGGLRNLATPRHYTNTTVRIVIGDLLNAVGEKLSPTSNTACLSHTLPYWTTARISVGAVIGAIMTTLADGTNWRVLPDGTVWIGKEAWPDAGISPEDYQILAEAPDCGSAEIGLESPVLLPGTTLGGRKISYVEHALGQETRTEVHFEEDTSSQDRLKRALGGAVRAATSAVDYHALYFATVISQDSNTIDVRPEDPRLPSMGNVPLLCGLPKWTVSLAGGGRVLIGWSGGNPARPYALAFDGAVTATKLGLQASQITINDGSQGAARKGDTVKLTMSMAEIGALATALLTTGGFLAAGVPGPGATPLAFTGGEITSGSDSVKVGG